MKIMVVLLLMLITNFTTAQTPNTQFNIAKIDGTLVVNIISKYTINVYNSLINKPFEDHNINSKYTNTQRYKTTQTITKIKTNTFNYLLTYTYIIKKLLYMYV